ncbi:MAG: hypothetical protein GXO25_02135 [Euryarchaeota archaeon]|nr:hypothetical protein [Euryarchaeota archaeon]
MKDSLIKKYWRQIASFLLSIGAVLGSFFAGWLLIVLSPIFVFLIFKFLGVWKNKERLGYGLAALLIGILLFFFIFSYQMDNVETQKYEYGNYEIVIHGYSTPNASRPAYISVTYAKATNATLNYEVVNTETQKVFKRGYVIGTISNNKTHYYFNVTVTKGIYFLKLQVGNDTSYGGEILRAEPSELFHYFLFMSGGYVIVLLAVLYSLLIFGVHSIRRTQELNRLRYEHEKKH